MRLPTYLLLCILVIAACNGALAAWRQFQLRTLPPPLAETHPADAFASQLAATTDPVELRRLAFARHRSLLDADHTTRALLTTVRTLSRSDLIQSSALFLLALGICFSDRRSFRSSNPAGTTMPDP